MRVSLAAALLFLLAACSAPSSDTVTTDTNVASSEQISTPEEAEGSTSDAASSDEPKVIAIGHSFVINSRTFGNAPRAISVRVPAGYEENKDQSYPVVYLIDGGADQDFPHIAGIAQSRGFELTPPFEDQQDYMQTVGTMPGGALQFRQFIESDVMPWVNERYRTTDQTAVLGESLAGLFIVDTLLKQPDLFDDYIAVSPSLWWDQASITQNLKSVFSDHSGGDRRLYLTMADEGFLMQKGLSQLVNALKANAPSGLKWTYIDRTETEHHGSIYHPAALDAFRKLYPMAGRTGGSMKYLYEGNVMPELSADAKVSLQEECNLKTARKVTFAEKKKDLAYWNGMCVIMNLGDKPSAGNWDY